MKKRRLDAFDIFNYFIMTLMMVIMIYPLLNVVSTSLSSPDSIRAGLVSFYPKGFNITGYQYIVKDGQIFTGYKNTILYAGVGTILTLTFTSLAAYALTRPNLVGRKVLTFYWALTMFFGGGTIATYLVIRDLGLLDTFAVMVIPGCVGAYTLFVFRSFMFALPNDLMEAAYIDGAGDFRIWWQIVLPLSKPLLATYALFTIVGHWNSWYNALLYLKDASRHPLQLFLRKLIIQQDLNNEYANTTAAGVLMGSGKMVVENAQMAAVVLTIGPILLIYPYIQKYFVKGVMLGSLKG